ncbi:hypothetical protein HOP50_04g34660 [Chloropicon primus]|uniref:Uncharacterized protein n=2 Tax=Chloropicon primus TaxID=1764295 RepID=A0A5B8MNL7_9CHLO|nr:hypothetical protein A3770_04p34600 [Chloropicon primus]UPR00152.1 hypothetical protein HOP50_04g34660 [Chloropicon primus]|eukprot:QDZ20942.1 hypothetical protein A3770_04p34600 [Chloropicon primus]
MRWGLRGVFGGCGGRARREKGKAGGGRVRETSGGEEPLLGGSGYVEVSAKGSLLIDGGSLEMGREAIGALRRTLEGAREDLSRAEDHHADEIHEREKAHDSVSERYAERDRVLKEVLDLSREIEGVKHRTDDLRAAMESERDTQARLEIEAKQQLERGAERDSLRRRNQELDEEIRRAQEILRTERDARTKAQAQANADIQQATAPLRQREENCQADITEADKAIKRRKDEQEHLRTKISSLNVALEQAESDVSSLLQSRRDKMDRLHDQLIKCTDSPMKAEYRRASQRLQKEKEDAEVLKLQANILAEQHKMQEERLLTLREKKSGWEEEERSLKAKIEEHNATSKTTLLRKTSRKLFGEA